MKKKIAVTGGIGSGKSTVCKLIENMGYSVFSCDKIYQNIIHSKRYVQEIERVFPSVVKQGEIDKKLLSEIVFSNEKYILWEIQKYIVYRCYHQHWQL